eukprot:TRINITY_DN102424_c0_g1_i1.p1 TRINITY_DN102424_c0_g1~~TRINITY_DN102424_c0_g1_i1.p1  ORF type:complete len:110 (+),score=10.20 TRINITY_DN102424_c0_g1_i1:553-882(+)
MSLRSSSSGKESANKDQRALRVGVPEQVPTLQRRSLHDATQGEPQPGSFEADPACPCACHFERSSAALARSSSRAASAPSLDPGGANTGRALATIAIAASTHRPTSGDS